jgi:hypothetical protein
MRRYLFLTLMFLFFSQSLTWAGLGSRKAMYVGGTISTLKENTEGTLSAADDKFVVFEAKGYKLSIPYAQVTSLEYGQKAGRRVGLGVAISPVFLFSKKRRHYLTIGYVDESKKPQAAVLELGKDVIKPTLSALEAKAGRKIEYQDEESRKSAGGK